MKTIIQIALPLPYLGSHARAEGSLRIEVLADPDGRKVVQIGHDSPARAIVLPMLTAEEVRGLMRMLEACVGGGSR